MDLTEVPKSIRIGIWSTSSTTLLIIGLRVLVRNIW